jgi:AcrR family transcriptional regulator
MLNPETVIDGPALGEPQKLGRKRNPAIDERALTAAIRVYVFKGWDGFNFDAVAREAGVGKPALYRRWTGPAHLLIDAFGRLELPTPRNCGSLRADLLDYGHQFVQWYSTREHAFIAARLAVDRWDDDDLSALYDEYVRGPRIRAARNMAEMAIRRGEIRSGVEARTAIELLLGSMNSHFTQTRKEQYSRLLATFPDYVETVVDIILRGINASSPEREVLSAPPAGTRKDS